MSIKLLLLTKGIFDSKLFPISSLHNISLCTYVLCETYDQLMNYKIKCFL